MGGASEPAGQDDVDPVSEGWRGTLTLKDSDLVPGAFINIVFNQRWDSKGSL